MAIEEYLDLKLLVGTIVPSPPPVIVDKKEMDDWEKLRKFLRSESEEKTRLFN